MPRLKKTEIPFSKMSRLLIGYGLNAPELSRVLKVSEPTARKRLSQPELFTLGDLDRINRFGHVPIEEIRMALVQ